MATQHTSRRCCSVSGECECRHASWVERVQLAQAFAFPLHDEPAVPGAPAVTGEAKKRERTRTPPAALLPSHGQQAAKLDQARLVRGVRANFAGRSLRISSIRRIRRALGTRHEVVGITHNRDRSARMPATPSVHPKIEDVIRKMLASRADAPLCGVSCSVSCHSSLSRMPASSHRRIRPVGRPPCAPHSQRPLVVDRVEKATNISVEHPVHAAAHDHRMQRRQRLVRVPPGQKPDEKPRKSTS
jgi:hypothetical protein